MKKLIFAWIVLLFLSGISKMYAQEWQILSANRNLHFILQLNGGTLHYSVFTGKDSLIQNSVLGISTDGSDFSKHLVFINKQEKTVIEQYVMPTGKRKNNLSHYQQVIFSFQNAQKDLLNIEVRVGNEGVAFRYHFPGRGKKITVNNELTSFKLPLSSKVWMQAYDMPSNYTPAYEVYYENGIPAGTNAENISGWAFPVLVQNDKYWMLLSEAGLDENYFASHLHPFCDRGEYRIALPLPAEGLGTGAVTSLAVLPFSTPWRFIIIGTSLSTIVESNMVYDLAPASVIKNMDWIRPGISSWSWWSDHASSKNYASLASFIDFSKKMNWTYSLIDANWDIMSGGTMEQLVKYAADNKVALSLWYNSGGSHNNVTERPRNIMSDPDQRKAELKRLQALGIKAVKVDFFQSDKQSVIQLYLAILKDAAAEQIMVDFHGCTLPRGWARTYPNLMSMEAVRGAEQYGWDKRFGTDAASHNTILAFTRNVVGSMDYTPTTLTSYNCCAHTTTSAHELALPVIFESGITHIADKPSAFADLGNNVQEYLQQLPSAWDDIKFIDGEPGKAVVLARKKGSDWYLAGINGATSIKSFNIALDFLNTGSYEASMISDGATSTTLSTSKRVVDKSQYLSFHTLPKGGFVVWLKKQN